MAQCDRRNLSMMMDLYEMTMANGYFAHGNAQRNVTFDLFYRKNPDGGGFAVFAGLEQMLDMIVGMHFEPEDIDYFRSLGLFGEDFLRYLEGYRFRGDVEAMAEGTIVYPGETLVSVTAPLLDAQLVETMLLAQVNHQSLIATKAARIVRAAAGRGVSDFGARRAHNVDAAVYGARAAYIGGVDSTATVLAGQKFGIPVSGTMAHSWVMFHDDEFEAFQRLRRDLSARDRAARRHLRRAALGHPQRNSHGARGARAARRAPQGRPHRLGRPRLPLEAHQGDARRGGAG